MDFFHTERDYIRRAAIRESSDIIHAHWTYEFALGALASGIPTLVTVRDWAPKILRFYKNTYRFVRFIMDWKTFRTARYITANSHYIQDLIWHRFRREVPVLPNPIEDSFLRNTGKQFRMNFPTIVSINNGMDDHKNVKNLIAAFKTIRQNVPFCRLRLVGEEFAPGEYAEQWSKEMHLGEGIDFIGPIERTGIVKYLDEADLLIHPSLEESFGNTLIEAMARRVPIIAGMDSGAVPWVLDYGNAGILCNVRDPNNIAEAAIDLLNSGDRWHRLSMSGYKRVVDEFSTENVIGLCMKEYKQILDGELNDTNKSSLCI
jgi:Glycosyltransferase